LEIFVVPDAAAIGAVAAGIIAAVVRSKPDAVLGVATGGSPLPVYAALAGHRLDLSRVRAFALDEYVGLPAGHPESYGEVVRREVTERLGLDPGHVRVIPNGYDPDDFPQDLPAPPKDRFVVSYAGTVFKLTSPPGLLAAIRLLREREPTLAKLLQV